MVGVLNEAEASRGHATQRARILRHLQKHGKITNLQINNMYILRGAARIKNLRDDGHKIRTVRVTGALWMYIYEGHEDDTK